MRGNDQETLALTDNCRDNSLLSFNVVSGEGRGGGGREDKNACQCNLCPVSHSMYMEITGQPTVTQETCALVQSLTVKAWWK